MPRSAYAFNHSHEGVGGHDTAQIGRRNEDLMGRRCPRVHN